MMVKRGSRMNLGTDLLLPCGSEHQIDDKTLQVLSSRGEILKDRSCHG